MSLPQQDIVQQLRKDISVLRGYRKGADNRSVITGLGVFQKSFPDRVFPTGVIHEFISPVSEDAAATNGFIAGLMSCLTSQKGTCLWISSQRTLFPPALKVFGIEPERIIFVDLSRQKEVLWTVEEALKCDALAAVVGELKELTFTESRRLQLAVEQSRVTGFIHRHQPRTENPVACVTRWKIRSLPSMLEDGLPGVGFPRWNVHLAKVRNGHPGTWDIEWTIDGFRHIRNKFSLHQLQTLKAG